jgi:tetratricopeptide (TPR) repeat protein
MPGGTLPYFLPGPHAPRTLPPRLPGPSPVVRPLRSGPAPLKVRGMDARDALARGRALVERGEYEMAEAAFIDAIEAAAGDEVLLARARLALGELYLGLERNEEASALLHLVIRTEIPGGAIRDEVKRSAMLLSHLRGWYV